MEKMSIAEFQQPRFIIFEKGMVDYHNEDKFHYSRSNSFSFDANEDRTWVYHPASESLIEFVYMNELGPRYFAAKNKIFYNEEDTYTGYFVKNNARRLGFDEDLVLVSAWEFLLGKYQWDAEFMNKFGDKD